MRCLCARRTWSATGWSPRGRLTWTPASPPSRCSPASPGSTYPTKVRATLPHTLTFSVADPDPGSMIRKRFFSESRIPNLHIWELNDNFVKEVLKIFVNWPKNFFFHQFKNKIIFNFQFKKRLDNQFLFNPFCCYFWIWDPGGSDIQDSGYTKIRIRDPG